MTINEIPSAQPNLGENDPKVLLPLPELSDIDYVGRNPNIIISRPNPALLRQVVVAAWNNVDWSRTNAEYWDNIHWQYESSGEMTLGNQPDEIQRMYRLVGQLLTASLDFRTKQHLQPIPGVPVFSTDPESGRQSIDYRMPDWYIPSDVHKAVTWFANYMVNFGQPHRMLPLVAHNKDDDEPLGLAVYRISGVKHLTEDERDKIGSVERVIVDPKHRRTGIATDLIAAIHHIAINKVGQERLRAWILTDGVDWTPNYNLFERFGYLPVSDAERVNWGDFCASRHMPSGGRQALWFEFNVNRLIFSEQRIPDYLQNLYRHTAPEAEIPR